MSDVQPLEGKRRVRSKGGNLEKARSDNDTRDWTIKSLSPETVEVSREAARRSGMKINAWVGKALEAAAASEIPVGAMSGDTTNRNDNEVIQLEQSILREISDLKAQNESLVQTVNGISSMLIKMYSKID